MTQPVAISKVPDSQVSSVKSAYEHLGAKVAVMSNGDGTSTITAVFPSSTPDKATVKAVSVSQVAVDTGTMAHIVMLHDGIN